MREWSTRYPAETEKSSLDALQLSRVSRGYVYTRIILVLLLTVSLVTGWLEPQVPEQSWLLVLGLLILAIGTVAVIWVRARALTDFTTMLWGTVPGDLVAWGILTYSVAAEEDPFFPMFFALAVFVAIVTRRRTAWVVGTAGGFVYLLAQSTTPRLAQVGSLSGYAVLVLVKAGLLPVFGYLVGTFMARLQSREAALEATAETFEMLNLQHERRLGELQAISSISDVIHSSLDYDEMGPRALEILRKVIDVPACALMVVDAVKDETLFSATVGRLEGFDDRFGSLSLSDAVSSDALGEVLFTCEAIIRHNDLSVIFCAPAEAAEALDADDRMVLQAVASELAVAVENSQLYKLTRRLAITDGLTGLYNYRYLQQRLEQEHERANRYNRCLSLLMLDVDHFKRFNDSQGHIAGDQALSDLGRLLLDTVREVDVVVRYGGEEFSVLLPETDAAGAFVTGEKIREAVALHRFFDESGKRTETLTLSVGVATFPVHAVDKEGLLRQADDALYQAKRLGRDRVRAPKTMGGDRSGCDVTG